MTEKQGQWRSHGRQLTQFLEEKIGTFSFDILMKRFWKTRGSDQLPNREESSKTSFDSLTIIQPGLQSQIPVDHNQEYSTSLHRPATQYRFVWSGILGPALIPLPYSYHICTPQLASFPSDLTKLLGPPGTIGTSSIKQKKHHLSSLELGAGSSDLGTVSSVQTVIW